MAQQNTLDFLVAAHVSGMEQMAKLMNSVGALQRETEKLKAANKALAASSDAVVQNGTRYNNMMDAQSKAMRQARQGSQQLTMQFNDFFTSVATGANPVQAFSQQLGQVGYAMTQMGGKTAMLGNLIQGPLGIAILVATMALGPFIEKLLGAGEASRDAALSVGQLETEQSSLSTVQSSLGDMFDLTTGKIKNNTNQVRLNTLAMLLNNKAKAEALALEGKKVIEGAVSGKKPLFNFDFGILMSGPEMVQQTRNVQSLKQFAITYKIGAMSAEQALMQAAQLDLRGTGLSLDKLRQSILDVENAKALGKDTAEAMRGFNEGVLSAGLLNPEKPKRERKRAMTDAEREAKKLAEATARWSEAFPAEGVNKAAEVYEDYRIMMIKSTEASNKRMSELDDEMARNNIDRAAQMAKEIGYIVEAGNQQQAEQITKPYEALQNSFQAIGQTVSDAFKGMITGATSWKDAMRGIINSVIDQLWQLYVVQQIVGFVTKALGKVGAPLPGPVESVSPFMKAANGTINSPGGLTWVGERGPELVNLPRGSQVIPAHRAQSMGGGGVTVNVDARGSSDPAAVRAQVQQGIMEAAPAIIAAAQARTVSGLRRPRLGGAMQ